MQQLAKSFVSKKEMYLMHWNL